MKMTRITFILIIITVIAFVLRFIGIDKFPSGFNADEAAIGYNAYSIIKTGKDEYGEILPLSFKSFGDYKPGLFVYFAIPFVATLGLNETAVRLPSVILGTFLVFLIYFLSLEIFKDKKVALISAVFMAINPWAIHFSRGAWESNAAAFFITLGVYLFIKGLKNNLIMFLSLFSFLVSIYLYQSPRLVAPVIVLCFIALFWKDIWHLLKTHWKKNLLLIFILFILSIPVVLQFLSGSGSERFQGLSFLSDEGPSLRVNELRGEHENPNGIEAKSLHNKAIAYGINFLGHYLDHYTADFLFINGDPLIRNKTPETGQFFIIQSLFLIVGLLSLIKFNSKLKYVLIIWILAAPLASSLTYQTPSALRSLSMVSPLILIISLGFIKSIELLKIKPIKITALVILISLISFEFIHYTENYYVHSPKRYPLAWEYGFKEMVQKLNVLEKDYNHIVITDRYDQPYILMLFYKQYDPSKYQPQAVLSERDKFNFGTVKSFDKYRFEKINYLDAKENKDTLYVVTPEEAGDNIVVDKVLFPNGEPAFLFVRS